MSALPERRESIDIDEFERRLRAPEPPRRVEDPLAELARLLGQQQAADPVAALFAENRNGSVAFPPREEPQMGAPAPVAESAPAIDPLAGFPDLRPLMRHGAPDAAPPLGIPQHPDFTPAPPLDEPYLAEQTAPSAQYEDWAQAPELTPETVALEPPRQRSRKPLYVAGAVIAAGFVAIGSTLAWRGGAHQAGGVATIAASTNPTKVAPKEGESADKPARESTMLERAPAPPVKKVVAREEAPMDVSAAAKTPRIIPLEEGASGGSSGASSVPAVAPPAPPVREPSLNRSAFPEPKRVKTVSVRADGSIIGDAAPAAPAAAPKPPERTTAPAPARAATPKAAAKADATTSTAAPAKPAAAAPKPKIEAKAESKPAPKPAQRVAAVPPPAETQAAAEPADDEDTPKAASSGSWALQIASAGSEAEARQTASRLGSKFSGALSGRQPSVVKASDSLYRVRITGLSKESAAAMCGKVKAAGGACFVAR